MKNEQTMVIAFSKGTIESGRTITLSEEEFSGITLLGSTGKWGMAELIVMLYADGDDDDLIDYAYTDNKIMMDEFVRNIQEYENRNK